MSWVKVDDQFFRHPKVVAAGRDARDLYLAALCYSAGSLTDGFVPAGSLRILAAEAEVDNAPACAELLLTAGLWEQVEGGYQIHDWLGCAILHDPTTQEQRKTPQYERWRRAVLERDDFTCRRCGAQGCELHAHHIVPWADAPATRFAIDNGETLCVECHRAVHRKYGS